MLWENAKRFSQSDWMKKPKITSASPYSRKMQRPREKALILSLFLLLSVSAAASSDSESANEPVPAPSVFSARPTVNYRTKVLGTRYGEAVLPPASTPPSPLTPRLTVKSYEEPKTETHAPLYDDDSYEYAADLSELTEKSAETTTVRHPLRISLRRNIAQPTTIPQDPTTDDSPTEKPRKSKPRRRKVKRPHKKSTTPKSTVDDLGDPEGKTGPSTSSGDKNLALEIGSSDGKYALISQFFGNTSAGNAQPPGIISYAQSDDFVGDNAQSLGKLEENDIWLSEGHLLVVKGGDFDSTSRDTWAPIDDYQRDRRKPPLRIALNTDNPPPFPVFVNQTGPPVFIGPPPPFPIPPGYGEFNESFDPSRLPPPGLIPLFPNGSLPGGFLPPPPGFNPGNHSFPPPRFPAPPSGGGLYGNGGPPGGVYGNGYGTPGNGSFPPPPFPFPPPRGNGTFPPPPPFYPFGPPGNGPPPGFNPNGGPGGPPFFPPLVLNPKDNETDDPSIFLPPPYDFDYHEDNTTIVPPGPFAPGLVVPPPRDFYRVYEKASKNTSPPPSIFSSTPNAVAFSSEKPQRQNGKKPKFPITSPPDDSVEANFRPTAPSVLASVSPFPKKRKDPLRGKSGKSYPLKSSSEETSSEGNPAPIQKPTPLAFTPRKVSPSPKPLNYLYVHGKLKTLAEIAAEEAVARGEVNPSATPAPAFDALGYPNRAAAGPIPSPDYDYIKKKKNQRKLTPKVFFAGQQGHRQISPAPQQPDPLYPSSVNPNQQPLPLGLQNNNNQGQTFFYQNPFFQQPQQQHPEPQNPTYFSPGTQPDNSVPNQNSQYVSNPALYQSQQPYYTSRDVAPQAPSYERPTPQSQYSSDVAPQAPSYERPTPQSQLFSRPEPPTRFSVSPTPTFTPTVSYPSPTASSERKRPRSRIIFPDDQDRRRPRFQQEQQPTPQIYNNPFLYQTAEGQGYYSPISQYKSSLAGGQFVPNTYFRNPNRNSPGIFTTQFLHPNVQQTAFYPSAQYQQQPQNTYYNVQQLSPQGGGIGEGGGQVVPLHADVLVNYREPLPQYNTESESVTTRSVLKAGPSPQALYGGNQPAGEIHPGPLQGSFYAFERGGPGGFSYKIHL